MRRAVMAATADNSSRRHGKCKAQLLLLRLQWPVVGKALGRMCMLLLMVSASRPGRNPGSLCTTSSRGA